MALYAPSRDASITVPFEFNWVDYGITASAFNTKTKVLFSMFDVTPGTPFQFTVPDDYQSLGATLELIGGGENGETIVGPANSGRSGGGGAYVSYLAPALTAGAQLWAQLGTNAAFNAAGTTTDTWVNFTGANAPPAIISAGALAKGGKNAAGGLASASIGSIKFNGGNGVSATGRNGGNGPGGAAGPHGAGTNGGQGGAGSGNNGGGGAGSADGGTSSGANGGGPGAGGNGGNNRLGVGGGIGGAVQPSIGGDGTNGGGAGGGDGGATATGDLSRGGNGSVENLWTDTSTSATAGPGAGGAGGGGSNQTVGPYIGGNAGLSAGRGAGGASGGRGFGVGGANGTSAAGTQGLIVLTYISSDMLDEDIEVDVDLAASQSGTTSKLDNIAAVHIDNTNSYLTIYVQFDDTKQQVIAAPGAVVYQPIMSNNLKARILASGFTGFVHQPRTIINFTNRYIAPNADLQQVSVRPQVLRSTFKGNPNINQQKFGYLAVGDLMFTNWITVDATAAAGDTLVTFVPPIIVAGYYVYITDLSIFVYDMLTGGVDFYGASINLVDTTKIVNYTLPFVTSQVAPSVYQILDLKNSQIKYPASSILSFSRSTLVKKNGTNFPLPVGNCIASIAMNYSIVDERDGA